eukprot:6164199-Pyramimonas_sp.AAC.1
MGDFHGTGPRTWAGCFRVQRSRDVFDLKAADVSRKGRDSQLKLDILRLMSRDVMPRPNVKHIEDLIYVMKEATPANG